MKKIVEYLLAYFFRIVLWFRYRVKIVGLEKLTPEALNKKGGVVFLPNHPCAFTDPILVTLAAFPRFPIRPMIVEYMYYTPIIHTVMKFMNALPIPNFSTSSNSIKKKKSERVIQTVIQDLKNGQNFLIYPSGKLKSTGYEAIGGASGVHYILQEAPEANVVLVRTKGLWGSSFSKYHTGKTPPVFKTLFWGIKECFKNLLFFTPRREVIIELEPAPADFPRNASRLELNRYLENWYNTPDGMTPQQGPLPGDSLVLVSYSMWGEKYLPVQKGLNSDEAHIDLSTIPEDIQEKVKKKLAELSEMKSADINPDMDIASDIGLDSIDMAELSVFLHDQFDVKGVPVSELTTVKKLIAIAARQIECKEENHEPEANISKWNKPIEKKLVKLPEGETIPEIFLKTCEIKKSEIACGDMRTGVLTYSAMKMRVILLAEYIKKLPGDHIGILLPASVAANLLVIATQLAGKVPVMVNWTVGPRHLETVVKLSNVQVVLTSWAFIDRLENVNLDPIEPFLVMLEDAKQEFTLGRKIKAFIRSKMSVKSILKTFGADKLTAQSRCVLLFTSGTESMPKGVPWTYNNILSNLRAATEIVDIYTNDVLFGILPPFHSFGFTISGLFALLVGIRVAYSPNPTDSERLANEFEKWKITIMVGAPTFLKGLLKFAKPHQLETLRLFVSGAEKAPPELLEMLRQLGKEESLLEGYGITECSPVLTMNPINGKHKGVGQPLPGVEICIVHPETYEDIPNGQQGLILARGPNIFSGYLNPDVASPFIEHKGKQWFKTGDLGILDDENYVVISGRLKRFVKIGGEMISLSAIEEALLNAGLKKGWKTAGEGPAIAICAKEVAGEKTKIYMFSKFETNLDEVNQALKDSGFSNLGRISSVTVLPEIPILGTGKVNYRSLESQYLA